MEQQIDFLGRDASDLTVKRMSRFTEDQSRNIDMALERVDFRRGYSMITRFLWIKLCDKINNYPKEMRHEIMTEVENTVNDVVAFLPVFRKQIEQNNRGYYGR